MERPKRNNRRKAPPDPVKDEHHSLETPSCSHVQRVVKDVILAAADSDVLYKESSLLGTLVLQHLLEERRNQNSNQRKQKKRKKKKPKKFKEMEESNDASNGNIDTQRVCTPQSSTLMTEQQGGKMLADETSPIVTQWLDVVEDRKSAGTISNRTLTAFCQELRSKPHILTQDISTSLSLVACVSCRAAVESFWHSTGIPMQDLGLLPGDHHTERIVLEASMVDLGGDAKGNIPFLAGFVDDNHDIERAFDYHAMEEGLIVTSKKSNFCGGVQSQPEIVALEPIVDKEGKIEAIQVSSALDATTVARLVRQIILPCGLIPIEHPNAVTITDEQLSKIELCVTEHERRFHVQLADLSERKSKAHTLFHAASVNTSTTTNYDVKEATALTECDKECDQLLSAFTGILIDITFLTDSLPGAEWAHTRTNRLWDFFYRVVQRILDQSLLHENKLLQLANRPGVVPLMFMNAAHRSSFYDVVKVKYNILNSFYSVFLSTLQDDTEKPNGPRFLQRLITYQPVVNGTIPHSQSSFNKTAVDNLCEVLLVRNAELVQIIRGAQLSEAQKVREQRCALLHEALEECERVLMQEYYAMDKEGIDAGQFDKFRIEWNQLIAEYKSFLPRREPKDDSDFQADLDTEGIIELVEMRQKIILMVINLLSQWRCLRWMRSQTLEEPVLPLRVQTLMKTGKLEPSTRIVCHGGGGKRRFACVLASLLFESLIPRCIEWHAELTQAELLESMSEFNPTDQSKTSGKKIKKKKKGVAPVGSPLISENLSIRTSIDSTDSEGNCIDAEPFLGIDEPELLQEFTTTSTLSALNANGVHKANVDNSTKGSFQSGLEPTLIVDGGGQVNQCARKVRSSDEVEHRSCQGMSTVVAHAKPQGDDIFDKPHESIASTSVIIPKKHQDPNETTAPPIDDDKTEKSLLFDQKNDVSHSLAREPSPTVPYLAHFEGAANEIESLGQVVSDWSCHPGLNNGNSSSQMMRLSTREMDKPSDQAQRIMSSSPREQIDTTNGQGNGSRNQQRASLKVNFVGCSVSRGESGQKELVLKEANGNTMGTKNEEQRTFVHRCIDLKHEKIEEADQRNYDANSGDDVMTSLHDQEQPLAKTENVSKPEKLGIACDEANICNLLSSPEKALCIGVETSKGNVQTAESFLVRRLNVIFDAGPRDDRGNPIVFL